MRRAFFIATALVLGGCASDPSTGQTESTVEPPKARPMPVEDPDTKMARLDMEAQEALKALDEDITKAGAKRAKEGTNDYRAKSYEELVIMRDEIADKIDEQKAEIATLASKTRRNVLDENLLALDRLSLKKLRMDLREIEEAIAEKQGAASSTPKSETEAK